LISDGLRQNRAEELPSSIATVSAKEQIIPLDVFRPTMRPSPQDTGFAPPASGVRRNPAVAELVATAGLALATIVTAIAVTVGVAHADVADSVISNEGSIFAVALVLGLAFIGMGGLTLPAAGRNGTDDP
jgi:hypothetical protein